MADRFDLDRFVEAQAGGYETALAEIRRGIRRGQWMWYIFPQVAAPGGGAMAPRHAIRSLGEARAYLAHPVLGIRYRDCVAALQDLTGTTAEAVFGTADAAALHASLTLFAEAGGGALFIAALDRWFAGERDDATIAILEGQETRAAAGR